MGREHPIPAVDLPKVGLDGRRFVPHAGSWLAPLPVERQQKHEWASNYVTPPLRFVTVAQDDSTAMPGHFFKRGLDYRTLPTFPR
jgi:hypothetical protein